MKAPLQSKTIVFHMVMTAIQAFGVGFSAYQPFLEPLHYVIGASFLGVLQSVGGIYLRFLTDEPIR